MRLVDEKHGNRPCQTPAGRRVTVMDDSGAVRPRGIAHQGGLLATFYDLAEGIEADGPRWLPDGRLLPELLLAEGEHLKPGARGRSESDDGEPDIDQSSRSWPGTVGGRRL